MLLNGGFTYTPANQRELLFDVRIAEVDGSSGVFVGKNSECRQNHANFPLSLDEKFLYDLQERSCWASLHFVSCKLSERR